MQLNSFTYIRGIKTKRFMYLRRKRGGKIEEAKKITRPGG
jgi:hypothetical protein